MDLHTHAKCLQFGYTGSKLRPFSSTRSQCHPVNKQVDYPPGHTAKAICGSRVFIKMYLLLRTFLENGYTVRQISHALNPLQIRPHRSNLSSVASLLFVQTSETTLSGSYSRTTSKGGYRAKERFQFPFSCHLLPWPGDMRHT
jgi:hypothetical protein